MTKEEAIEQMIKDYKDGIQIAFTNFCLERTCAECPFYHGCRDSVFNELFERLLKAEEKKETNLEHYWRTSYEVDDGESYLISVESSKKANDAFHFGDMKEWLLSPYEKPKYKLTQFEYDLLSCYCEKLIKINDIWILAKMKSTGYYNDIPTNVSIKSIIDNCEVVGE